MHPLKKYRSNNGKTQQEMADAIGCGRTAYLSWENLSRYPSPGHVEKIEEVTARAVTAADLFAAWRDKPKVAEAAE